MLPVVCVSVCQCARKLAVDNKVQITGQRRALKFKLTNNTIACRNTSRLTADGI